MVIFIYNGYMFFNGLLIAEITGGFTPYEANRNKNLTFIWLYVCVSVPKNYDIN